MKQKSRTLLLISWLVLRLRWSLIFVQQSFVMGGLLRGWAKPGIIQFTRQPQHLPLERWSFDESRGVYLYADQVETAINIYLLPERCNN